MWECGLKHNEDRGQFQTCLVTPYVGVWIETERWIRDRTSALVTPYVGVWIETYSSRLIKPCCNCHSLCGSVD